MANHVFVLIAYVILMGCRSISAVPLPDADFDDLDIDEHDAPYRNLSKPITSVKSSSISHGQKVKSSSNSHDDLANSMTIPPLHIRDKDVKEVENVIIGGVSMVQNSLINFISGIFDSFKKVVEKSSGKVVHAISDSINRTNSMNADYISAGKDIVGMFSDTFSKGSANLTRDFEAVVTGGRARGPRLDDQ